MFKGLVFCFSGALSMVRRDIEALVEKHKGKCSKSVTLSTTHLVTTDTDYNGDHSKVMRAKELGIHIVNEDFIHDSISKKALQKESTYHFEPRSDDDEEKVPQKSRGKKKKVEEEEEEEEEDQMIEKIELKKEKGESEEQTWQWKDDEGKWKDFSKEIMKQLEENKDQDTMSLQIGKSTYTIHFKEMKQENDKTKYKRDIRKVKKDGITWKWKNDDDEWEDFNQQLSEEIEQGYKPNGKLEIKIKNTKYSLDFKNMTQENLKTNYKRDISRGEPKKRKRKQEEEEEEVEIPKSKGTKTETKKVIVKGKSAVDSESGYAEEGHIYEDGDLIYNAVLNQTDVNHGTYGKNKFYIIQLIVCPDEWIVFCRWGRVGAKGTQSTASHNTLEGAIKDFEKKFKSKTGNTFGDEDFVPKSGKYSVVDISHVDSDEEKEEKEKEEKKIVLSIEKPIESKLDKRIQRLMKLIYNLDIMKETMLSYNIDLNKMPLGKLSKKQISLGYNVLQDLQTAIRNNSSKHELGDLSSEFYSLIPHNFGRRRPEIIDDEKILRKKLEMLQTLNDMEIATTLLKTVDKNETDSYYDKLNTSMSPVEKGTDEYTLIENLVNNTHASTHLFSLKITDIFNVERQGEAEKFEKNSKMKNRRLLWHGSRTTNYVGILSQGLRIAPPEAPSTGYMFGKGVYFADSVSKSANYCHVKDGEEGCLLLAEVALGDMYTLEQAEFVTKLDSKYQSTFGIGKNGPDEKDTITLKNGCTVCPGKLVKQKGVSNSASLLYNEFIVYDTSQILLKYIVRVKFSYNQPF